MLAIYIAVISLIACASLQAETQGLLQRKAPPPASIPACPKPGPLLSIEYLYWEVEEDQLYPAVLSDQSQVNGLNTNYLTSKNQKFEYTSGFRAGVGYQFGYEKYDVNLAWTYLHPRTTSHFAASGTTSMIAPPFFDQTDSDAPKADSVVSHWHLNFDMLDLELGRKFRIGRRFNLRPNIGLKGGWINQTQKMSYNNVALSQSPIEEYVQGTVNRKNNFEGIGPRVGVDLRYGVGSQFGIFSALSGALLYGNFDLKTKTYLTDTSNNGIPHQGPLAASMTTSDHHMSPTLQILLGVDWSRCIYQKYQIRFGVAYEVQYWWNQLRTNNSIAQALFINCPSGDLMMHGLTVQGSFVF